MTVPGNRRWPGAAHRRRGARAAAAVVAVLLPGTLAAEASGGAWPVPAGAGIDAAYLAQLLVGLIVVIAAILVLAFLMRRVGGVQSRLGSDFRVLGGISLGSRERMVLVQVGERQLLVGVAPGRVQALHVLEEPIRVEGRAAQEGAARSDSPFARRLRAALNREQTP
ncbi:flagellar biosynthetic protein FliO [Thioalkalivibrio sp.]|uniref:flagellar biosynthetic protein FliO n=3 Tax=Thioalkalivibrio sp. TaxID=2093813 RepID=UPI00356410BD